MYKSIANGRLWTAIAAIGLIASSVRAQLITVDPDAYPDGTVLNSVIPGLSLITAGPDNVPWPFNVTAMTQTFPYSPPTGDKVFAHASVPFWNDDRRLRMDFNGVVSTISIAFMGSNSGVSERGQLNVYGVSGQLLGTYTTQPLFGGQVETMGIQRNQPDIAWAVAYTLPGDSPFGRLDHLVFSQPVAVPEPGTVALFVLFGGLVLLRFRCRVHP